MAASKNPTTIERQMMVKFATRHHDEHDKPNDFCRKCKKENLHKWAREAGLL